MSEEKFNREIYRAKLKAMTDNELRAEGRYARSLTRVKAVRRDPVSDLMLEECVAEGY